MKKSRTKNKKKPWLVVVLIVLACVLALGAGLAYLYGYSSHIEKEQYVITSDFSVVLGSDTGVTVNAWKNRKDGKHYLFLPSDLELKDISVHRDGAKSLTINGTQVPLDTPTQALNAPGEYELKFDGKKYDTVLMQSKNVPSVHIETQDADLDALFADKNLKAKATIKVFDGGRLVTDSKLSYVKGRGNGSWVLPQKPVNIKFKNKTELFDLGHAKKYALVANYMDQSLIKNDIAYTMADGAGLDYTSKYRHVDLYINGNYLGSYLLTESVTVGKDRVDIADLDDENEKANPDFDFKAAAQENTDGSASTENGTKKWVDGAEDPADIGSGYLMELDMKLRYGEEASGFVTENGQAITLKSPEYATKGEIDYISAFYQDFEDALVSENGYNEKGKYYLDYIDLNSFAKAYLIHEFSQNRDANLSSAYMYLDASGKIKAGPMWDFDNAFGNQAAIGNLTIAEKENPRKWEVNLSRGDGADGLFMLLFRHSDFRTAVCAAWKNEVRPLAQAAQQQVSDEAALLKQSAVMNGIRWNRFCVLSEEENAAKYGAAAETLKQFIAQRTAFLDEQLNESSAMLYYASNGEGGTRYDGGLYRLGDKAVLAENPFESDKVFRGWNTAADGSGTAYAAGEAITLNEENTVLYAQWSDSAANKIKTKIKRLYQKTRNSLKYRYSVITG